VFARTPDGSIHRIVTEGETFDGKPAAGQRPARRRPRGGRCLLGALVSGYTPPMPAEMALPWVESPFFRALLPEQCADEGERALATRFHEQGYLVLEKHFPEELLDRAVEDVKPLFDPDVPDRPRSRIRVQDAWKESGAVREIALDEHVQKLLRFLYGRRPIPFQTLSFQVGTEQRAHSDTLHFHCFPPRFLCGVWVALEDVSPENGTLFYYPGSNRLPESTYVELGLGTHNQNLPRAFDHAHAYRGYETSMEALMEAHGLERVELIAEKGDVLIWAANLVHGGGPVLRPGSSRWSQVTHYYFEDCLYYTPMHSNWVTGDVYLRKIVDLGTGKPVPNVYRGVEIDGVDEAGTFKLLLDRQGDRETVRALNNEQVTHLKRLIDEIECSWSYKLSRMMTAPLRWLR
jgi:hypothetical protein